MSDEKKPRPMPQPASATVIQVLNQAINEANDNRYYLQALVFDLLGQRDALLAENARLVSELDQMHAAESDASRSIAVTSACPGGVDHDEGVRGEPA